MEFYRSAKLERTSRLHLPSLFLFSFSLFCGPGQKCESIKITQLVCVESVIDAPDLKVCTHCSGLSLGGLSIWPTMRRGNIWPYRLKTSICICLWKMSKIHSCSISSLPFHFSMSAKLFLETSSIFTNSLNLKIPFIPTNTLRLGPHSSVTSLHYLGHFFLHARGWDDQKNTFSLEKGTCGCSPDRQNMGHTVFSVKELNITFVYMCRRIAK